RQLPACEPHRLSFGKQGSDAADIPVAADDYLIAGMVGRIDAGQPVTDVIPCFQAREVELNVLGGVGGNVPLHRGAKKTTTSFIFVVAQASSGYDVPILNR